MKILIFSALFFSSLFVHAEERVYAGLEELVDLSANLDAQKITEMTSAPEKTTCSNEMQSIEPKVPETKIERTFDTDNDRLCFNNDIRTWNYMKGMRVIPNAAVCSGISKTVRAFKDYAEFSPNCKEETRPSPKEVKKLVRMVRKNARANCPLDRKVKFPGYCSLRELCEANERTLEKMATGVQITTLITKSVPTIEKWKLSKKSKDKAVRQKKVKETLSSLHRRLENGELPLLMYHDGWGGISNYHFVVIRKYEKVTVVNEPDHTIIRLTTVDPNTEVIPPTEEELSTLDESQRNFRKEAFKYQMANGGNLEFTFDKDGNLIEEKSSGNIAAREMIFDMSPSENKVDSKKCTPVELAAPDEEDKE